MKDITTKGVKVVGIDLAKTVFHLHGANHAGKRVFTVCLKRHELACFINQLPNCLIAMEACSGAHYWANVFSAYGHHVKLISPQFVKMYVKSNKNDWHDAEAIVEAATRPQMRFVPIKNRDQIDVQSLHRVRQLLVSQRTALSNQLRGLLGEYGIVLPVGMSQLRQGFLSKLDSNRDKLSEQGYCLLEAIHEHFKELDQKIQRYDRQIDRLARQSSTCQRLMEIEGIGPKTATIITATVTTPHLFKNGRELAAWLGLVPKQHSSGGRTRLLGISKRGDNYIRYLLVHGARSALRAWSRKKIQTSRSRWAMEKLARLGYSKASVALANKLARTIWVVLARETEYDQHYAGM